MMALKLLRAPHGQSGVPWSYWLDRGTHQSSHGRHGAGRLFGEAGATK